VPDGDGPWCNAHAQDELPPIPFTTAALRVFDLSLSQMLWSRRTVFMALVVGGPVFIAAIVRLVLLLGLPTSIQPLARRSSGR